MESDYQIGDILLHERFGFHLLIENLHYRDREITDYDTDETITVKEQVVTFINLDTGERKILPSSDMYGSMWLTKVA